MARKHAQHGARRAGGRPGAATACAADELDRVPAETSEPTTAEPPTTAEIQTNPVSGPITVPYRVELGDSGVEVHSLGLSTGALDGGADAHAADLLDRFAGLGGDLIAVAGGPADPAGGERLVGAWLASRGTRDRVRLMTRVRRSPGPARPTTRTITDAVDASLGRLGTDRIDLLAYHDDDPETPLEEILGALDALLASGKVLALAAAGCSPERLIQARVLAADGLPRFQALATPYHLLARRGFEGALGVVARAQGLAVLPQSPLAGGVLGRRLHRRGEPRDATAARRRHRAGRRATRVLRVLGEVADAHGTDPAAVAVAWLLARPAVAAPVVAVRRPDQVDALMRAASLVLTRSELVELDRASA